LDREIWFDSKKTGECVSLLIRKLAAKTIRTENRLPLRLRHLAKITEGSRDKASAILGKSAKLLHGPAYLLSLRRRETFHRFGSVDNTAALLWRHVIKLRQAIAHPLLSGRREVAKAGLILQSALLIGNGKVAMTFHPLRQVFLIFLRPGSRSWSRPWSGCRPNLRDGRS
jgi:hypothetical protein